MDQSQKYELKNFFPFVKGGDVYVLFSETIKFLPDCDVNCPYVKRVFPQNCTKIRCSLGKCWFHGFRGSAVCNFLSMVIHYYI